jgi:hypothetical protein
MEGQKKLLMKTKGLGSIGVVSRTWMVIRGFPLALPKFMCASLPPFP